MNQEKVWEDFTALPLEAQQQAADFIAFLRSRYRQFTPDQRANLTDLGNEAFIGMWRDYRFIEGLDLFPYPEPFTT